MVSRTYITHGQSKTRLYKIRRNMKQRCYNPNHDRYKDWGGRGITMCDDWLKSPKKFMDWAIANGYKSNLSIERINNDKGYSPENCKWATISEQSHNKRMQSNNKSGYVGVCWDKKNNLYESYLKHLSVKRHIGFFADKTVAVVARNRYIINNGLPHKIQRLLNE